MIIAVCGYSGSGKTSFIEELLPHLEGYTVAVVKHTDRDCIDTAGKDTARHRAAGADAAAIIAGGETAVFWSGASDVETVAGMLNAEVVLLEGFKSSDYEKIWLGEGGGSNVVMRDPSAEQAASYIGHEADVERALQRLPGLDCGDCGYQSCMELARVFAAGDAALDDCVVSHGGVTVTVDGTMIPLKPFVQSFVEGTVRGMLRSLKGVEDAGEAEVRVELPRRS